MDRDEYLAACWCEINGGGIVTSDQIEEMQRIIDELEKQEKAV